MFKMDFKLYGFFWVPPVISLLICSRRSGAAVTLVTRDDWMMAPRLIPILERSGQVRETGSSSKI